MAIQQLSVFLENRKDKLYEAVSAISEQGINIRAMSIADTKDFGVLRLITDDNNKAKEALSEASVVTVTPVIAAKMEDKAGSLAHVLQILSGADINIEYMYAFTGSAAFGAYVVLRVNDVDAATAVLTAAGVATLNDADIIGM